MDLVADVLRNACRSCTSPLIRLAPMGCGFGRLSERCTLGSIWAYGFREHAENERA
jgi:hypothetical protein